MDVTTSHLFLPGFVTHRSACYVLTLAGHRDVLRRMNSGYSWVTPMRSRQQDVLLDLFKVHITELVSWNSLEVKGLIFSLVSNCKTLSESGVLTPAGPRPVWLVRTCAQMPFLPGRCIISLRSILAEHIFVAFETPLLERRGQVLDFCNFRQSWKVVSSLLLEATY